MGIVCCSRTNNMEIEINRRIINPKFSSKRKITSLPQLVILLQSYYRRHSAIIKLKREIEQIKDQISFQLDKKKLINDDIITECESEKLYQKLILTGKIKSYMEIVNSNKTIKKDLRRLEKLSFFIPNYIVASPTEVYKGSWNLNKKYHGYGIKYEFNTQNNIDSRTEGTFNNGLLFGFGRIILSNGEQFIGRFANGKMMGNGEYIRKDGSIYKGQFFEGLPHGKGNEIMSDGSMFDGDYFWGKPKRGKIIWKDGSNYEGEFENGKINGIGTYDWGNNKKYIGNWKEGKMDGRGKFIYSIQMELIMWVNLLMGKKMDKENMYGMKINIILDNGKMINLMVKVYIINMEKKQKVFGLMVIFFLRLLEIIKIFLKK